MTRTRAIILGSLVFMVLLGAPASGQAAGSVELVAQSAWVDDGGIYDLQVRVAGADPESSVVVRVFPAWADRSDFLGQELPVEAQPLLELEPVVLGEIQNTSNEVLPFQIAVAGPDTPIDEDEEGEGAIDILSTDGGSAVFPVDVALYDAEGALTDRFLTSLIELPRNQRTPPLQVAIALETHVLPATQPDGSISISETDLADMETLVNAMAQHPSASVALSISPETLAGLDELDTPEAQRILELLVDRVGADQLFANPYTEVQEQAWIDGGLAPELRELYLIGSGITNTVLGTAPDPSVMFLDPTTDDEGLAALTDSNSTDHDPFGVEAVIVRPEQVTSLDRETFPETLTTRFVIPTADGRTIPALVADGDLADHFTNPGSPTFNANRLLADLTLLSLQNADVRQAVVLSPPTDWTPDATFLNVMLTGLERVPAIRGVSPVDALAETAFTPERGIDTLSTPLQRQLEAQSPEDLRSFRTDFSQARTAIDSWSEVIVNDRESNERLESLLRLSTDYRLTDDQRSAYIDTIYSLIENQKDASITTPESETITLTGRLADVPITLNNDLGVDANVLLVLDSEKLAFPDGQALSVTLRPGPNRIDVPIEARASGDSPIRVQVFTPDRSVLLGSSEVLVRTLAFSGVGIVIGAVSLLVLLLWWLRHARSSRGTVAPDTSASTEGTPDEVDRSTEHIGV